jgi:Asp-tRNA(Asn)/Glu-tRNA(Gln) amidotransferase A subunit family amidase
MDLSNLYAVSAVDGARLIREGVISSEQLMDACLARVREVDGDVQAWAFLDPEHALEQARAADRWKAEGNPLGPLHGVPLGIKDIIDTGDMPTENGSPLHAGRTPSRDASVVALLRGAGAVIMGKTVTTEFASGASGKTRNPHNAAHTPGGSSSGSAAAVAAGMVPLAVGSQTGGSVIRPGAYCGVYAVKPTHGLIPRHGMWRLARSLDHVGLFARSLEDLALGLEQAVGYDERDPDSRPRARIPYRAVLAEDPPLTPMLAFVKTPRWDRVDADAQEAFAELAGRLGAQVEEVELPSLEEAWAWQATIMEVEMADSFAQEWEKGREQLSSRLRGRIERGRARSGAEYLGALRGVAALQAGFTELFEQRYDAILTTPATGTAPVGLESTGDPMFCSLWTMCGMPAVTLPLMQGANGLPLGVQLVGARHGDARLLRTARWLIGAVQHGAPRASLGPPTA